MKRILSIDFDYFINATNEQRERLFPDGADRVPSDALKRMWEQEYINSPEIRDISVIKDYDFIKELLSRYTIDKLMVANSHSDIKAVIDRVPLDEELAIVNIDFHHDFYHYFTEGNSYNCGNWLLKTLESRPDTLTLWVRREDSQIYNLSGEVPIAHTTNIKLVDSNKYDYIFMCLSPEWTPPHLIAKFNELIMEVK